MERFTAKSHGDWVGGGCSSPPRPPGRRRAGRTSRSRRAPSSSRPTALHARDTGKAEFVLATASSRNAHRQAPEAAEWQSQRQGRGRDWILNFGWLTLVGLVYLLEPGLGLLRARRVRRRAAAGDLVRVPPLHRRQAETKRVMLCSMSSPGGRTKTEATRKRKEIIDRDSGEEQVVLTMARRW